jgi:tetratricopeptide (TPR) repeat protein
MLICLLLLLWLQDPATLAREHVKEGLELSQKGDLRSANIHLEKALKLDPNDVEAPYYLAVNQYRLGQFAPAKTNLERILRAKPGMKPATLLLGAVLEKLNDYRRAIRLLESVADLVRQQPEWIAVLARCYYHADLVEKGRETLDWLRPAGPVAVFLGAETAAQSGDPGTAEKLFVSIRSTYPDRARLGYELAMVQYQAKHFADSQATLQQLTAAGTRESRVYNLLSWCYHRQNRLPEALAAMKQAIELEPAAETNYDHLAQMLIEEGRYADANEAAEKALVVAPKSSAAYQLRGRAETRIGNFNLALRSYARAAELNPADAGALLNLALVQEKLFQYREAAGSFEKGIARFPGNPQFYEAYGRMLLDAGSDAGSNGGSNEARAASLLEKAIALDDQLAGAHYELGKYLLGKDKVQPALVHLEAAAKLDPQDSRTALALAGAYRRLGRKAEAGEQLRKFKELEALKSSSAPPQ